MNETITRFLEEQNCASVCCIDEEGKPYCFSCFYAFDSNEELIYFKSSVNSHHAGLMKKNPFIAGTVLPDKLNKLSVKGIQFEAIILDILLPHVNKSMNTYFKKHPIALVMPGEIWALQINHIKMTDSTLGFGKKLIWNREELAQKSGSAIIKS